MHATEDKAVRYLQRIERFGWALAQALLPFGSIVFVAIAAGRFLWDPSWIPPEAGAASAVIALAGGVARMSARRRSRRQPNAGSTPAHSVSTSVQELDGDDQSPAESESVI